MSDRELLEAAARACGLPTLAVGSTGVRVSSDGCKSGFIWNSLTDDGDALRLAVRLRFGIKDFSPHDDAENTYVGMVEIWREDDDDPIYTEWYKAGDDRYAATRKAITRAAAEIGRKL